MSNVEIQEGQVIRMLDSLDYYQQQNAQKKAFREATRVLVRNAKQQLSQVTLRSNSSATNLKRGWHIKKSKSGQVTANKLSDGIRAVVDSNGEEAKVHIMGDFRLKWFEKGTVVRKTKKNANRGQMKPTYFFKRATLSSEAQINDTLINSIDKSLNEFINR